MTLPAWRPNVGPQLRFLSTNAFEVLFGGAAGGGKSDALIAGAARFVDRKHYKALLLRRTVPELEGADGLVERSMEFYAPLGGIYNSTRKTWRFPSGARIDFRSCEHERDVRAFSGWQLQYLGFDELTTFTEGIYTFLLSRLRSTKGIPCFVRSTSNPGGEGHDWVLRRWRWWLYREGVRVDEFEGPYARPGETLLVRRDSESGRDELVLDPILGAQTRTFIPARLADNPALAATDYGDRLKQLDPLTRRQLEEGDWMARAEPGMFFRRADFRTLPVAPVKPAVSARVRYWDRAATEARPGADPDWTVGVLMSRTVDGLFVIEHVIRAREEPAGVYRLIKSTAAADHAADADTWQVLEQEPGSSGKADAQAIARELAGCNVRIVAPSGDKVTRAKPLSAQAAVGNCAIVGAVWNLSFLDELESFPKGHDDQVDAASGAFNQLAPMNGMKPRTGGVRPLARAQGGF